MKEPRKIKPLVPWGVFIRNMLAPMPVAEQEAYLGLEPTHLNAIARGYRQPSKVLIQEKNWEALFRQRPAWQSSPAKASREFARLVKSAPEQSPYEKQKAKPGSMGEVFETVFGDMTYVQMGPVLGVSTYQGDLDADGHPVAIINFLTRVAKGFFKIPQQQMAVMEFRTRMKNHCEGRVDDAGKPLWDKAGAMFDDIALASIADSVRGGRSGKKREILTQWNKAVGQVFQRVREEAGMDMPAFFATLQTQEHALFGTHNGIVGDGLYAALERGAWHYPSGSLHQCDIIRSCDVVATRSFYLKAATQICDVHLKDYKTNAAQAQLVDALENYFPEIAVARRARDTAPQFHN